MVHNLGYLLNMQWSDYDDFEKKYGTDSNPEGAALRLGVLYEWNGVGYLLKKKGMIDRETAYRLANNVSATWLWKKFARAHYFQNLKIKTR